MKRFFLLLLWMSIVSISGRGENNFDRVKKVVDWRISRKDVDGQSMIRVATGAESADGVLGAQSRGLWFDANGVLQRAHFVGFDARYSQFEDFHDSKVPHQIDLLLNGQLAMRIKVASLEPKQGLNAGQFKIAGHEWKRQFTDETR